MAVRWDAVVAASRFWTEPQDVRGQETPRPVTVQVWLFGRLAPAGIERPLELTLTAPFTVRDVVAALGGRLGADFQPQYCRVFVDGAAANDFDAPLAVSAARIEMILLTGIEGG